MLSPYVFISIGLVIGIIPIALGITALATPEWLKSGPNTFSLLVCNNPTDCLPDPEQAKTTKALEIAGVVAIGVGVIIAATLGMFTKSRWILLIALVFVVCGSILVLIGFVLYAKYLFQSIIRGIPGLGTRTLDIGYSFILIILTCIIGFITAIYFAFLVGKFGNIVRDQSRPVIKGGTQFNVRF